MKNVRLKTAQAKVQRALETYRREERQLFNALGGKIYSDEEHARRLDAIRAPLKAAIDEADSAAAEVTATAEAEILQVSNRDPLDTLTPEQLAVASSKRALSRKTSRPCRHVN